MDLKHIGPEGKVSNNCLQKNTSNYQCTDSCTRRRPGRSLEKVMRAHEHERGYTHNKWQEPAPAERTPWIDLHCCRREKCHWQNAVSLELWVMRHELWDMRQDSNSWLSDNNFSDRVLQAKLIKMDYITYHQEITRVILCCLILNDIIIHMNFFNDTIMF